MAAKQVNEQDALSNPRQSLLIAKLDVEMECDDQLVHQPMRTQFELVAGRLLSFDDYVQEVVSLFDADHPLTGTAKLATEIEKFRSDLNRFIIINPPPPTAEEGSYAINCTVKASRVGKATV